MNKPHLPIVNTHGIRVIKVGESKVFRMDVEERPGSQVKSLASRLDYKVHTATWLLIHPSGKGMERVMIVTRIS